MQDQPVQSPADDQNQSQPQDQSYVDEYAPVSSGMPPVEPAEPVAPSPEPPSPSTGTLPSATTTSESLEDQNIFYLLGVDNGSEEQKETFLDELQQVIWEDFLENDVRLLLTKEEAEQLNQLTGGNTKKPLAEQEEVVVFLEKLIPDLEEIMLEKALELKADLVKERIAGLRELYAGQTEKLEQLNEVENLVNQEKWLSAARTLNELSA